MLRGPAHRRPAERAGEVAGLADGPDLDDHAVRQVGALLGDRCRLVQAGGLDEDVAANDLLGFGKGPVRGALAGNHAPLRLQRIAALEYPLRRQAIAPGVPARERLHALLARERRVALRCGLAENEEIRG